MSQTTKVLGEDVEVLIRIFPYFRITERRGGMMRFAAEIPNELATPFLRALMRREARLLKEDADELTGAPFEPRTPDQRRVDAFVDLVLSVSAASRYTHSGRTLNPPDGW